MIFLVSGLRRVSGVCGLLAVVMALTVAAASPNPEAVRATPAAATSAPNAASAPSGPPSIKAYACDIHDVDDATSLPLISIVGARNGSFSGKPREGGDIGLASIALDFEFVLDPAKGRLFGWRKPRLQLFNWQCQRSFFNVWSLAAARGEIEMNITGGQRGMGRIGGDFWQCLKGKSGQRLAIVTDRYPHAYWHSMNIGDSILGPGPSGPAGTARLEVFREGLQECEARIAIETVLTDAARKAKLGDELAKRAQDTLDERQKAIWLAQGAGEADFQATDARKGWSGVVLSWNAAKGNAWFLSSGWQKRTAELFTVAGEVEKKAPARP